MELIIIIAIVFLIVHLADLGATGTNARNSDGYFYW